MRSARRPRRHTASASFVALLVLCLLLANTRPAYAYIDPGSGSMLVQLLLGGFAGFAVIVKLYWARLTERVRFRSGRRRRSP